LPVIGNIFAKIDDMRNPMTFVLFIKDGLIEALQGASTAESTAAVDFVTVRFEILGSATNTYP
jgi:hypothetical protein